MMNPSRRVYAIRRYLVFLMGFLAIIGSVQAHEFPVQALQFDRIGIDQGLSQSSVNCIFQDSRGFLWFGTQDGLNKYDGFEFTIFRYSPGDSTSISDNSIQCITEDSQGYLWVGTETGGLNRYDRWQNRFISLRHAVQDSNSLGHDGISDMVLGQCRGREVLWVATLGGGLQCVDIQTFQVSRYPHPDPDQQMIFNLFDVGDGLLLLTSNGETRLFDTAALTTRDSVDHTPFQAAVQPMAVSAMLQNGGGDWWIGTYNRGLYRYHADSGKMTHWIDSPKDPQSLGRGTVVDLAQDQDGAVWVATALGGLTRLDPVSGALSRFQHGEHSRTLNSDLLLSLFIDDSGLLWVGSEMGVNKLNPSARKFRHDPLSQFSAAILADVDVWAFLRDRRHGLWVGTGRGLYRYDVLKGTHRHWSAMGPKAVLTDDHVLALIEDADGLVWAGTRRGLHRFSGSDYGHVEVLYDSSAFAPLRNSGIMCLSLDPADSSRIWIGTMSGLFRLERGRLAPVAYRHDPKDSSSLAADYIASITFDLKGRMWLGTGSGGLDLFEPETERFIHHTRNSHGLSSDRITSVLPRPDGTLWIATYGGGLNHLDPTSGQCRHFGIKDGLPNSVVYGILDDGNGSLWVSTNRGLSRFDQRMGTFYNYDDQYGLYSNEFNQGAYYKDQEGKLYFGGLNGFNAFKPDALTLNSYMPPVRITDFRIGNAPVSIGGDSPLQSHVTEIQQIRLKHDVDVITFVFAALDYHTPQRNQYACYMENYDQDWQYLGARRVVSYTRLPPGDYVFRVKASNDDGLWNEDGTSIRVKVIPALTQTLGFRLGLALILAALVLGGHQYRTNLLRVRTQTLTREVDERTRDLVAFNTKLQQEIKAREDVERQLRVSEERYRNFIEQSNEGIWRLEIQPPVPVDLDVNEQVRRIYQGAVVAECNNTFARMYGYPSAQEMLGRRMLDLHGGAGYPENDLEMHRFVTEGYRAIDRETRELDAQGREVYILNNSVGIVRDGLLLRIWGMQHDVTEQRRTDAQIRASLKEKEVLLKEIHHRVKNNMQVISSLLQLQSSRVADDGVIEVLQKSRNRVRSMALVHELLYQSHNLSSVQFAKYIRNLVVSIYSSCNGADHPIQFDFNLEDVSLTVEHAVPCGLVVNEIVTNTIKHAFPRNWSGERRVAITLRAEDNDQIFFSIQDSGQGLPDSFSMTDTQSLGLYLVQILIKDQLDGQIDILQEGGTEFRITFPAGRKVSLQPMGAQETRTSAS